MGVAGGIPSRLAPGLHLRQPEPRHSAGNGAGDTITPTIVNFLGFWLLEIPLAYLLAIPLHMRSDGVFFSIAISESSMAVASAILFRQGKWKKQKI